LVSQKIQALASSASIGIGLLMLDFRDRCCSPFHSKRSSASVLDLKSERWQVNRFGMAVPYQLACKRLIALSEHLMRHAPALFCLGVPLLVEPTGVGDRFGSVTELKIVDSALE
jgi:hypothetical protein